MAIYHSGKNHYTGEYIVHGGYGRSGYGSSGTVYLEDQTNGTYLYRELIIDNYGYTGSEQIEEVEQLNLQSANGASSNFYTYNYVKMSTDGSTYHTYSTIYYLSSVTDGSLSSSFISTSSSLTITLEFQHTLFVDHVKVYPNCIRFVIFFVCLYSSTWMVKIYSFCLFPCFSCLTIGLEAGLIVTQLHPFVCHG